MFDAMTRNENLPLCFVTVSGGSNVKLDWTFAFVVLSIVSAAIYYLNVYQRAP
jgi:hypothetical protein